MGHRAGVGSLRSQTVLRRLQRGCARAGHACRQDFAIAVTLVMEK